MCKWDARRYTDAMAARGSYAKGVAKRDEILRTALDVIAKNGYRKTSLRELAAAVGLSQTGLLHYFGTKEELYVEVLRMRDRIDGETYGAGGDLSAAFDPQRDVAEGIVDVVRHNADVPGLVRLYSQFSAEATDQGHPAGDYFRQRYETFRTAVGHAIRSRQERGELPATIDPDRVAALMAAASDGLQTQWLLDDSIDMADHIQYLWNVLRTG